MKKIIVGAMLVLASMTANAEVIVDKAMIVVKNNCGDPVGAITANKNGPQLLRPRSKRDQEAISNLMEKVENMERAEVLIIELEEGGCMTL